MHILLLYAAISLARPCLGYQLFDSRDAVTRSVIEACHRHTPNEKAQCYTMLRCVMDNIPSDFSARWSAGASILAFIPTIVGLMSNSINETTSIADESLILAVVLSMSSITAFTRRFGDRSKRLSETIFEDYKEGHAQIQSAVSALERLISQSRISHPWWKGGDTQIYASSFVAIVVGAGVWYEVYEITRYGIVAFACPVKANVGIWVGLSQLLTLLNVLCRSLVFDIHTVQVRSPRARPRSDSASGSTDPVYSTTIVLRSPRNTFFRWLLQTFTAIVSFTLYAYGTILLASMTLIPASDAIRAMVMSTISAGFGRLAVYWFTSPQRKANQTIVVDVPARSLHDFTSAVLGHTRVNL